MQTIQNANQLSGRATGALFFAGFGALWIALALYALERLNAITISGILLGLAILLLAALSLFRQARRWPRVPDDPAMGRAFAWINAIEWTAVAVAAFTLARLHLDAYVMCAITAIVGLHMFPLARLFRYAPHYWSGAILVAWAAASAFYIPNEHLQGISALGTGIILWLNAAFALGLAWLTTRESTNSANTREARLTR
jgi:drug/metabolite transporter (DMT)-like permease